MTKEDIEKVRDIPIFLFLNLKNTGRRQMVRCPFHQEKTPSCVIYPDNSFHCFGCTAHGKGAIDFFMKMGFSFKDTIEELKKYVDN